MEILLTGIILPCFVALVTTFLFKLFDVREKNKMYSLLGVEILTILIDDVETGLGFLSSPFDLNELTKPLSLPRKSWNGVNTISDEILLRVFELSKDIPYGEYHPNRLRINTVSYFEYTTDGYESIIQDLYFKKPVDYDYDYTMKYLKMVTEQTILILEMMNITKVLLDKNTKKRFPK